MRKRRTDKTGGSDLVRSQGSETHADQEKHIGALFTAELQFRLASAVHLATTANIQPLDLPMVWSHGQHLVKYEEIALRPDQADFPVGAVSSAA